jgi:hypothetical protein
MTVHGDNYVLDSGKSGHARLRVISKIHDDRRRPLLHGAGLEPGDRYVEFGCGLGYGTRWATSIGADALGIDLSADQIAEVRELAGRDDRVPCRKRVQPRPACGELRRLILALAAHSPEPAGRRHAQHLRGAQAPRLMVCEEADMSAIYADPPSGYHEYVELAFATGDAPGVDYAGGRRLHR